MKLKSVFVCGECGFETAKWLGKCPACGKYNTFTEDVVDVSPVKNAAIGGAHHAKPQRLSEVSSDSMRRIDTGIREFNRVLGGGIVPGSAVLLGGEPGTGKSTILLQMCAHVAEERSILYVSGEESASQIKLRANRLGVAGEQLFVLAETDIGAVLDEIGSIQPGLVVIDSIQTMSHPDLSSSAGSITQVRECANLLLRTAKDRDIPIFIVGHVNKDGAIAGPKVMEHIVDAVVYFEGERNLSYRIMRTVKNRFGSTNEIGVFEMTEGGLVQVENPSASLLSGRPKGVSGSCVVCHIEGSRPILSEVQALVSRAGYGNPRRMATGFDYNRCAMLLAVLEKRCSLRYGEFDVYLNVVGGLKLDEPASDLAVCLALVSGLTDTPIPEKMIAFGEVGLAGEIRAVNNAGMRVMEAAQLGFSACILPARNCRQLKDQCPPDFRLIPAQSLQDAFAAAFAK